MTLPRFIRLIELLVELAPLLEQSDREPFTQMIQRAMNKAARPEPRIYVPKKLICPQGHPLTPENTMKSKHNGRIDFMCRLCHNIVSARNQKARKEKLKNAPTS